MKIAICGAGIAGPCLAWWLDRAGHQPVLIEKAPGTRAGGYVIDFWGTGYEIARRMGLLPAVLEAGYRVREVRIVGDDGRRVGGFPADVFDRITGGCFTSLPRGELARVLWRAVEDRAEVLFGDSIHALSEHAGGVRVTLDSGGERDFDMVVGADGLHSRVRALAFGPEARFERPLGYYVAAFEAAGYRPRDELVYAVHNRPGRQAARFSMRGDRTMILFVFTADRAGGPEPAETAGRRALLRRVFRDAGWECPAMLSAMEEAGELYFDRVSQIVMERWSRPRVALLGDAGAAVSLLAGEGAGLAMTSAYLLAGELAAAAGDLPRALSAWEARMRPFVERKQRAARRFAAAFAPRSTAGVRLRNAASRLLRVPALADLLVGRDLRDDFDLPRYPL